MASENKSQLACVYAALVLHDDGVPITEEKLNTLIKASGVEVESYWPSMFAKLFEKVNMDDLINNIGSAPAAGAAAPGAAAASGGEAEEKEEEKEEEAEEEEEEEMEFDLFD